MIRFSRLPSVIALAALAGASPAHAEPRDADRAPGASEPAQRVLRLSLADAIALSLKNNPDLIAAGFAPRRAAAEVRAQRGAFDPVLSLSGGVGRDRIPPGSVVLGTFRNNVTVAATVSGRLSPGTEYALSYGTTRLETDSQLSPTNPSSSSYVQLDLRQPLLRGFGRDVNEAGITIARGGERMENLGFRRRTEASLTQTADAYWRLVRAHKSLAVARESRQLAEQLVQRTQTRVEAGDLPTIELTQARASVAARAEAVISSEAEVGNANDALARLLVVDPREVFAVTLIPSDDPNAPQAAIQGATLIESALHQRADLQAARQAVKNAEVALDAARNLRRPDLSAVASVGVGGIDGRWRSAQTELAREIGDQHRWMVGLEYAVPLGNRTADGRYQKARYALEEAKAQLRSFELQVTEEVRTAVRNLDASAQRVETTRRAAELARDQLAAGEKRHGTGLATAFEVLRLQTDLAAAQTAEIAAAISYRTSAVHVLFATGALLDAHVATPAHQPG